MGESPWVSEPLSIPEPFRVAIVGPDALKDYDLVASRLDVLLGPKLAGDATFVEVLYLSGDFGLLVDRWSQDRPCVLHLYPGDMPGWNCVQSMLGRAQAAVVFRDGNGGQVEDVLGMAREQKLRLRVVNVQA